MSMGTIHVNTDLMRQLGRRFIQCNEYIRNQLIPELQHLTAQMEGDWVGVSRARYDELLQGWTQSASSLQNWGNDIGQHIYHTADQFDNADRS
jgi:WXG100 family type VII secretion target